MRSRESKSLLEFEGAGLDYLEGAVPKSSSMAMTPPSLFSSSKSSKFP